MDATNPTLTPPPKRRWKRRLLRTLIALIILLILSEVLLRLIFGFGSPLLYQPDPDCGYLPKPNQNIYRFFCHNEINHAGMRSPEFTMPKPPGTFRVLFIGDSVTYGTTHIDQPLIFTSLIAQSLHPAAAGHVEVLDMSAGGWGPRNEAGYLLSRGAFDANVVLFVLNTEDLYEEFATQDGHDLNYPYESPTTAIGELWTRYLRPRLFHQTIAGDAGTTLPAPELRDKRISENFEALQKAQALCIKSGALFGIVYVPFAGRQKSQIDFSDHLLSDWTTAHHAPYIDTAPTLAKDDPAALTIDGMHLKAYGNQVVANEIVKQWPTIDDALKMPPTPPTAPTTQFP